MEDNEAVLMWKRTDTDPDMEMPPRHAIKWSESKMQSRVYGLLPLLN